MGIRARLSAQLEGRYEIVREIGAGGMATVYSARDVKHDRDVAIKVLRPELGAMLGTERFLREIRFAASLTHPHILPLFDSGEADGLLYYVTPLIAGQSLRERLKQAPLPPSDAARILHQLADALAAAHAAGIVHRDLKPENVLLSGRQPWLADLEPRLGAAVLHVAGIASERPQPEVDPLNYLSRVEAPVLMINGRLDAAAPLETHARPFFDLLGTPAEDKRFVVSEGGHIIPKDQLIQETLDWLDRYPGPVGGT